MNIDAEMACISDVLLDVVQAWHGIVEEARLGTGFWNEALSPRDVDLACSCGRLAAVTSRACMRQTAASRFAPPRPLLYHSTAVPVQLPDCTSIAVHSSPAALLATALTRKLLDSTRAPSSAPPRLRRHGAFISTHANLPTADSHLPSRRPTTRWHRGARQDGGP